MNMKKKVISAGTLVMDVIPEFYPEEGTGERKNAGGTVYLKNIATALGGSVGNTGLAMHDLGADVTLFSRVGDDKFGVIVEEALKETGCKYQVSVSGDLHTSMSIVVAYPHQDRMILHSRGASQRYCEDDIPERLLCENELLHFGYPTGMPCMFEDDGETLSRIFRKVKDAGLTTSMDTSFPGIQTPAGIADWRLILKKTLPYVDLFLPSFEEIYLMLHREEYLKKLDVYPEMKMDQIFSIELVSKMAEELIQMGAAIVVIKCGEKGAYLRTGSEERIKRMGKGCCGIGWERKELFTTPYQFEEIISTNGAGDTFVAGFLMGVLAEMNPEETVNLASACAAYRISRRNLREIKDYHEIEEKVIKGGKKMQAEDFDGWTYNEQYHLMEKRQGER
ncbi:MAG: carbohydrate kinase family protein [Lachnospiraceae bacterium]|nr:carbohydrate kinase family protein [Lacrimispora saccharolytica]